MSASGTLKVGMVDQSQEPSENVHTMRLEEYDNWNKTVSYGLTNLNPDRTVTLQKRLFGMQILVNLAAHTGVYTARLSILATNTNYRGPILLRALSVDTNPTLEVYDDAAYANLIYTFGAFAAATEQKVLVFPDGTTIHVKA